MAEVASGVVVLGNGRNLSCFLKTITVEGARDLKDSTALCNTSKRFMPGLTGRTVSGEGLWGHDSTTDAFGVDYNLDNELRNGPMTFSIGSNGDDVGDSAIMLVTYEAEYKMDSITPGELLMYSFSAEASATANAEWQRGLWLFSTGAAVTGTTNGTTYDSVTGGTGWLAHVHVVAGDGNAEVHIQHSTNGSVWVDLYNAAIGPNNYTAPSSTTDPVNRYLRARVLALSTTCTVGVAFKLGYTG